MVVLLHRTQSSTPEQSSNVSSLTETWSQQASRERQGKSR